MPTRRKPPPEVVILPVADLANVDTDADDAIDNSTKIAYVLLNTAKSKQTPEKTFIQLRKLIEKAEKSGKQDLPEWKELPGYQRETYRGDRCFDELCDKYGLDHKNHDVDSVDLVAQMLIQDHGYVPITFAVSWIEY